MVIKTKKDVTIKTSKKKITARVFYVSQQQKKERLVRSVQNDNDEEPEMVLRQCARVQHQKHQQHHYSLRGRSGSENYNLDATINNTLTPLRQGVSITYNNNDNDNDENADVISKQNNSLDVCSMSSSSNSSSRAEESSLLWKRRCKLMDRSLIDESKSSF